MEKQSFVFLSCLRSTSFGLVTTTPDDVVAFDVEDDEGIWACSLVGAGAGLRWLVLVFLRGKHCWLAGLCWLKPTSEQALLRKHVYTGGS